MEKPAQNPEPPTEPRKTLPWPERPERIAAALVVLPLVMATLLSILHWRSSHAPVQGSSATRPTSADAVPNDVREAIRVEMTVRDSPVRVALEGLLAAAGQSLAEAATKAPRLAERLLTALVEETGKAAPGAAKDLIGWLAAARTDPQKRAELKEEVFFGIDDASLSESAYTALNRVRSFADDNKDALVLIRTFADTTASTTHNRRLARRRADAIRSALTAQGGISKRRVFVSEVGEEELPHMTEDQKLEPRNRAAQILVQ